MRFQSRQGEVVRIVTVEAAKLTREGSLMIVSGKLGSELET